MTVTRQTSASVSRFSGLSSDVRPVFTDGGSTATLAVGSTFYETDTGYLYFWNGRDWNLKGTPADDRLLMVMEEVREELRLLRELYELNH